MVHPALHLRLKVAPQHIRRPVPLKQRHLLPQPRLQTHDRISLYHQMVVQIPPDEEGPARRLPRLINKVSQGSLANSTCNNSACPLEGVLQLPLTSMGLELPAVAGMRELRPA